VIIRKYFKNSDKLNELQYESLGMIIPIMFIPIFNILLCLGLLLNIIYENYITRKTKNLSTQDKISIIKKIFKI
jgi:hypothetical protein